MREFTKSLFSYSLAASLFPLQQLQNLATQRRRDGEPDAATRAFESATTATVDQLGGTLAAAFQALDNVQRGLLNLASGLLGSRGFSTGSRDGRAA